MKLASVETILDIQPHPNADKLSLATVLGYVCIIAKDEFNIGDKIVLIQPDTVLPVQPWAEMFRKRSNRVKAIKLRGEWSFGIVLSFKALENVDNFSAYKEHRNLSELEVGTEISDIIGVYKYEPPVPQDLSAKGYLPTGLPKTDEERYQNMMDKLPFGCLVDITLKIDGQSATYFCKKNVETNEWETGICSRSLTIKPECVNNYTLINSRYNILEKLQKYCERYNVNLALRGEIYGNGIQAFESNPHGKLPLDFAAFNVYNMDTFKYEGPDDEFYYEKVCADVEMNIPVVPMIQRQVILTKGLVDHYAKDITKLNDKPFEGVVIKYAGGSFKIINLAYDERK